MRWAVRGMLAAEKKKAMWVVSGEKERDHLFSLRSIPESTTGPLCSRAERRSKKIWTVEANISLILQFFSYIAVQ